MLEADPENTIKQYASIFDDLLMDRSCFNWPTLMMGWASEFLNPLQFGYCCQRDARMALDWFGSRLDPELFDACVETDPESALSRVLGRLSDQQFDNCLRSCPASAIFDPDAVLRMTWQQFNFCVTSAPEDALQFVSDRLTNQQLDFCCNLLPSASLKYAATYLTRRQLMSCYHREPTTAIEHAGHKIPVDLLPTVCEKFPELSLRFISRLSKVQRMDCICSAPWRIILDYPEVLTTPELLMLVWDYRLEVRNLINQSPWHEIVEILQPHLKILDKKTALEVAIAQEYRRQQRDSQF